MPSKFDEKQHFTETLTVLIAFLLIAAIIILLPSVILLLAWNAIVPIAFGGETLNLLQAIGLFVAIVLIVHLIRRIFWRG